ncbi:2,4'-dihydroxyacetophenone dioxygenase family protein [Govanella unica]|uniref:2,4'-dihydroxyacetophenone dioxygenase family protein n=1 Tax=Govanella unica TaxID=2975056 RepID=A0A9X3Z608_9PROT|nr:2,4'-dihydroxyacetophenone dioxygenase family protein [Govania unica]MDA5192528.1 2,4'-dihydroxyacetophenone dioxygenase family protein [Govania unica]
MEQLERTGQSAIAAIKPQHPVFFDPTDLPWLPWVMVGTHFKLLNVDKKSGGFSMLLKVDAGIQAPVHGHLGAVEAFLIEGEFGYEDDRGGVGSYVYEPAGARHEPTSPGGVIMFAVAHGPLVGYNDDGSLAAIVDGRLMHDLAVAGGAAGHLRVVFDD